mmetsp:Transcript_1839/g.3218  ORF Transcript_1839/g.3218 Transcript_1839/m.3218 type:complete len:97 (-) Transcript_1839:643-933(-)
MDTNQVDSYQEMDGGRKKGGSSKGLALTSLILVVLLVPILIFNLLNSMKSQEDFIQLRRELETHVDSSTSQVLKLQNDLVLAQARIKELEESSQKS